MSSVVIGIVGIVFLIALFLLGMPIAFSMALVGLIGFSLLVNPSAGLSLLASDYFGILTTDSLTAIPMFILMGSIAFEAGMGRSLYDAGYTLFGRLRGGLAMATVVGCAGFAAICGSTSATAAAMGRVALPEMKRYGYDDALATGAVAAAGSLGILIPPSTVFLVYGSLTQQSIGRLFIAGVLPGIILAVLFTLVVAFRCWRNPTLGPGGTGTTWREKIEGLTGIIEMVVLFALVIGGLFLGWFSPTQGGAIGAAGALIIGVIKRTLNWQRFVAAVADSLKVSCMVMMIVAGATVFGHFMTRTNIPMALSGWIGSLPLPPLAIMGVIILMYLFGGCFMDALAMVTLTIPIIYPVVLTLGFDPIWFGVIIVLVVEMGVITPPVGINVYVIKGIVPGVPLETIFKGTLPFLGALVIMAAILIAFPQIATFLPGLVRY